ncbi:MAG TPA: hypothetical protein VGO98_00675 [Candidatus Saccharimonadales bacterium]|jgi:hypothetical protein|nr:hypothetical protein [Candidatus Saccharimonadales bacterium]
MNKDIIYIDVEDDITAIIGKVKDAKQKIVALVPPKRIGILQSTVNLRLLSRAASQAGKHLVIITNNPALIALAAAAKLPVAKNLQSKPEIAEIAALDVDDGDDVIDGAQLPVGDLARTADTKPLQIVSVNDPAIDKAIEENAAEDVPGRALPPAPGMLPGKARAKSGIKVPNFNDFRKKLVIIGSAAVLLLGFLIWGIFFAPRATVQITARTSDSSVNNNVTIGDGLKTDLTANTIKATTEQIKKSSSVEFEATGTKDVGEKAKGTVKLSKQSLSAVTIPAGTQLSTTGGLVFATNSTVTLPAATSDPSCFPSFCPQTTTVGVTAATSGAKYNAATGALTGAPSGVAANLTDATSGGTDKIITVVTNDDIQKAIENLKPQDVEAIKKELRTKLSDDVTAIDQTFKASDTAPVSLPAVDQEVASGTKPKLTSEVTYSLSGIDKNELNDYLDAHFTKQLEGISDQRTYNNGAEEVTFTNLNAVESGFTANIVATAKIGPKIEDSVVKNTAKGKRYGEIQSSLEAIQGVDNVDVKFWPFWVRTAPNDAKKINIEFKLHES